MRKLILLLFAFNTSLSQLYSQNHVIVDSTLWQPDGTVFKTAITGDTLIIAGEFNRIGPKTPYTTAFDSSGKLILNFPHANGEITKVITDNKNGFYVAGNYSKMGKTIKGGLAYIDSNGLVSSFFDSMAVNGSINDMYLTDSTLILAGAFNGISKYTGGGAIIRTDTDVVNYNFPIIEGKVYASEPDGDGGVYIGGEFTKVGEFYRQNLAHIDKHGNVTPWNPGADGEIWALTSTKNKLYVGGKFTFAGCEARKNFAVFVKGSNIPDTLKINTIQGNKVFALEAHGGKLYIGTGQEYISGQGPATLYIYNINTEKLLHYNNISLGDVHALEGCGRFVFMGGDLYSSGISPKLKKIDTTSFFIDNAMPSISNGSTYAIKSLADTMVLVGGEFVGYSNFFAIDVRYNLYYPFNFSNGTRVTAIDMINDSIVVISGINRSDSGTNYISAFNIRTREPVSWSPSASSLIYTITKINNDYVFCGGEFRTISGRAKFSNVAGININTSKALNWNLYTNYEVLSVKYNDSNIYIGGGFWKVNKTNKQFFAKINPHTNIIDTINLQVNSTINAIELKADTLFIGGYFNSVNSNSIAGFAAVNKTTGALYSFANLQGGVSKILLHQNKLYLLGFSPLKFGSITKNFLAVLDANTGNLQPLNLNINTSVVAAPKDFAIWKDNIVCGGFMSSFNDTPRLYDLIFDINTGEVIGKNFGTSNLVNTISVSKNGNIFLGGRFQISNSVIRKNIAFIDLKTGQPLPWAANPNKLVNSFTITDGKIYFIGSFSTVKNKSRLYAAATYLNNDSLLTWAPSFNSTISDIHYSNGKLYTGGYFTSVNGLARKQFAVIDTSSAATVGSFNPFSSTTGIISIYNINSSANDIYVSGIFSSFNGVVRQNLASFNKNTLAVNSLDAKVSSPVLSVNATVSTLIKQYDKIYASGNFTKTGTTSVAGTFRINTNTNSIDTWKPSANYPLVVAAVDSGMVYTRFSQSAINKKCRCILSAIDTNNNLTSWYPYIDLSQTSYSLSENTVYIGGYFNNVNYDINNNLVGIRKTSLAITDVVNNNFCAGGELKMKINTTGEFDSSNHFILILSDTNGLFTNATYLDTIYSATDSFSYQIPTSITPKSNYRLKLISSSPRLENREDYYINIWPVPKADFTINDEYQCLHNNLFEFTNKSNVPGKLQWNFGDSILGPNASKINHIYKKEGIYNVLLILSPNGNGCPTDSIIKQAEILPQPQPDFIINDSVQCNPYDSFVFTNTSVITRGTMTYLWNFGNAFTSSDSNTYTSYLDTGVYTITLIATSDSGCVDSSKNSVLVIEKPVASFSINKASQCLVNNLFTFTNTSNINQYLYLTWILGDSDSSTQNIVDKTFAKDSTYIIHLRVAKDSICFDTASAIISITPQPISLFSVDTAYKCANDTFFFTNKSSIKQGNISNYIWDFGNGSTSIDSNTYYAYDSSANFRVSLITVSDSGCSDTFALSVTTNPLPKTNFEINDTVQCFKTQLFIFTDLSTTLQNDSIVAYDWDLGDSTLSTLKQPTHKYQDTGYYFVTLRTTNTFGCFDTAKLISVVAPEPAIDTIFGSTVVFSSDTVTYHIINDTFTTYFWSVDNGTIYSITGDSTIGTIIWDSVAANTFSSIKIFPVNIAGCFGDTGKLTVLIKPKLPNGVSPLVQSAKYSIYPNPASTHLNIYLDIPTKVDIVDITGKNIYSSELNKANSLDITMLYDGIYTILLRNEEMTVVHKLVVQKN